MPSSAEQKLFQILIADLERWEGSILHLYLDTKGLVTTGIGNLVATSDAAVALPFVHMPFGEPADELDKRHAWDAVKAMAPGLRARAYESASNLRLTREAVGELVAHRLRDEFLPGVRKLYPAFDAFALQAKQALVDLAYNCGLAGLAKFENLREAVNQSDWVSASKRCHRASQGDDRNVWCASMFMYAASQPLFI